MAAIRLLLLCLVVQVRGKQVSLQQIDRHMRTMMRNSMEASRVAQDVTRRSWDIKEKVEETAKKAEADAMSEARKLASTSPTSPCLPTEWPHPIQAGSCANTPADQAAQAERQLAHNVEEARKLALCLPGRRVFRSAPARGPHADMFRHPHAGKPHHPAPNTALDPGTKNPSGHHPLAGPVRSGSHTSSHAEHQASHPTPHHPLARHTRHTCSLSDVHRVTQLQNDVDFQLLTLRALSASFEYDLKKCLQPVQHHIRRLNNIRKHIKKCKISTPTIHP